MRITLYSLVLLLCVALLSFSAAAQKLKTNPRLARPSVPQRASPPQDPASSPSKSVQKPTPTPKPLSRSNISVSPSPARLATADATTQIRHVLDAQVAAWNAGKLEDFMAGYWRAPELTFYSGGQKLAGWDATLARYRRNYQDDGKEMGKLQFSDLQIESLGPEAAVVRERWQLTMADGKELGGLYTLIFRRFSAGWKIVHDHTSSDQ